MNNSSREHWQNNLPQSEQQGSPAQTRAPLNFGGPLPTVHPQPPAAVAQSSVVLPHPFNSSSIAPSTRNLPALASLGARLSPTLQGEILVSNSQPQHYPQAQIAAPQSRDIEERDYATMEEIRRQAEQRDREVRYRQSNGEPQILHQPVAVPPQVQGVHGPNGLLGSQGAATASLMAPGPPMPISQAIFPPHQNQTPVGPLGPQSQPPQSQMFSPFAQGQPGPGGAQVNQAQQPILNDALSYLDQVKSQFQEQPDVYNKFLDIMKEFKSGAIDTPGVIERVSQLFVGNPQLIQGFNTFLPPGYRIECGLSGDPNSIRVTTPMGTTHSTLRARPASPRSHPGDPNDPAQYHQSAHAVWTTQPPPNAEHLNHDSRLPPYGQHTGPTSSPEVARDLMAVSLGHDPRGLIFNQSPAFMRGNGPQAAVMDALVPLANATIAGGNALGGPGGPGEKRGPVEFNHAISYVNKIKTRFHSQPDIYKQFLEILQTYQRESKPIQDVYSQVTRLFDGAPDLLEDFKQFLPESAAHANAMSRRQLTDDPMATSSVRTEPGYVAAAGAAQAAHLTPRVDQQRLPPMGNFAPTPSSGKDNKRKRAGDKQAAQGLMPASADSHSLTGRPPFGQQANKKQKSSHIPSKPSITAPDAANVVPTLVPALPIPMPPSSLITASNDDVQMIDKIRKHINNKTTYTELIKLLNLFNQDAITNKYALHRLQQFVGGNAEVMSWLSHLLGNDDTEEVVVNSTRPLNARISLARCQAYGPSYRLLPKREITQLCSGRDELCRAVLNDEWASHPTWESEEAGFVAHKKTIFEEALHRIEEERHDYDSNIECLTQTISLVESIVKALDTKTPEERQAYRTDNKLGGQSEFIWKRTVYKLYGRDHGQQVVDRMLDNTYVVAPHLLSRLLQTRERWKAAQRQWNEVWRQQTLQNYHKSLDHQGTNQRATHDKRQFQPKTLQQEIKAKYEDQRNVKAIRGPNAEDFRRSHYQYSYSFGNKEVLMDTLHLIFTQLDHKNALDDPHLTSRMRSFFAMFLSMDLSQLRSASEDPQSPESEQSQLSETAAPARSKNLRKSKSLYQSVLKDKNKTTNSGSASRDSTPAAASVAEDEAISNAAADEDIVAAIDAEPDTWFSVGKTGAKGPSGGNADASDDPNSVDKDADIVLEDVRDPNVSDEPFERTEFHMYCNSVLYCFMRLVGMLYERLEQVYNHESEVKTLVEIQAAEKPAHLLFMIDKVPTDYFEDISPTANYYKQVVAKFESLIKGTDSVTQSEMEDLLRRYYLPFGFELYHLDKHLAQIDRLGVMMLSNDKEKLSEQLLKLYRQDRTREKTTVHDELLYQKQAMKHLSTKEKDGESAYRVTYNVKTNTMAIQLFDRASSQVEQEQMTPEQRYVEYLNAFATIEPTEGVPTIFKSGGEMYWPTAPQPTDNGEDAAEDEPRILGGKGLMGFKIFVESLHMTFNPGTEDSWVRSSGGTRVDHQKSIAKLLAKEADGLTPALVVDKDGVIGGLDEEVENDVAMDEISAEAPAEEEEETSIADVVGAAEKEDKAEEEEVKESVEKPEKSGEEKDEDVPMDDAAE